MYKLIRIRRHERGLHFRAGDFHGLLLPGRYWVRGPLFGAERDDVQIVDLLANRFQHPRLDLLVQDEAVRRHLEIVDLSDTQRAVVWKDGRVTYVLGPGRHAFWREPYTLRVERFDARSLRIEHEDLDVIHALGRREHLVDEAKVGEHEDLLVFRDGVIVDRLSAGRYVHWTGVGRVAFRTLDRREQVLDVAGQEIMTHDKVTLRVNLVVSYRVTDPVAAVTVVSQPDQALYRDAQLALRAAVGTRPIDALLADKESVGAEVAAVLASRAAEFGVAVRAVGLRDIVLPGDMKEILNQVITAQKEAEANVIRRREETAAARSQANTARLLADNPVLARVREFEKLQEILAGTQATFVLGQGDLAAQIRGLLGSHGEGG